MALKKSIGKLQVTSIQFQMILADIEAALKYRPLAYVSGKQDDHIFYSSMEKPLPGKCVRKQSDIHEAIYTA